MADIMPQVKEKLGEFPDSKAGHHWLFWLSLVAVGAATVHGLNQIRRGKTL
jgi:hypothetical protein